MPSGPEAARWQVVFDGYDPADERRRESLMGLGNGILFVRDWLPGADPADARHYAGSYRAGCYDRRRVLLDGRTHGHDSLVNLPNWLPLTFRAAGERAWFAWRQAEVIELRRVLDMRAGVVTFSALVRDAGGRHTRLAGERLVSQDRALLAALAWRISPQDWDGEIEIRSAIDGAVENANTGQGVLAPYRHLDTLRAGEGAGGVLLLAARTRQSRAGIAVAARTRIDRTGARQAEQSSEVIRCCVRRGETLTVEKVAAIVTERDAALSEPGESAIAAAARAPGFAELRAAHARAWARLWERVAIAADDPALDQACATHAFHLLQTASPHSVHIELGLPSRGWQEGYHGQVFWDEIFAFPFLCLRFPEIARALLLYRYRRLDEARQAARACGYAGAMFPWRSASSGAEETPDFQPNPLNGAWHPDHTRLQRHIGAAIAHNVHTYAQATGDEAFVAEYGAELVVEIARFWASIAQPDGEDGRFDIRGVIGPDEYHDAYPQAPRPGLDTNAYTNVMAAATLLRAEALLDMLDPAARAELLRALCLERDEIARWRHVAQGLRLCVQPDGVISQFAGFGRLHPPEALEAMRRTQRGRLDHMLDAAGDTINAYQMCKQPDVLMLLYLFAPDELQDLLRCMGYDCGHAMLARTVAYYRERLSHESSLSRVICAGALAAIDPEASWSFFRESLCIDFDEANSASAGAGLHLGAMAGTLDVLQRHYLGLRTDARGLVLDPAPPPGLGPVRMRLRCRGAVLGLSWDGAAVRLRAEWGSVVVLHAGRTHRLDEGETLCAATRPAPPPSGTAAPGRPAARAGDLRP